MGFLNNLRYRWRMLTNIEIAVTAMVLPGLVGIAAEDRSGGPRKTTWIRWPEFETSRVDAIPFENENAH